MSLVLWSRNSATLEGDDTVSVSASPYIPGPYADCSIYESSQIFHYVPPALYFYIRRLAPYPELLHHIHPVVLMYSPPEDHTKIDILKALFPSSSLSKADPRLWATIVQIYPTSLPESFYTYRIPLSDIHLPLLQTIPPTSSCSIITVLALPGCPDLSDDTILVLKSLTTLAAFDASETSLSSWGVSQLALSCRGRKGPWRLRILRLRNTRGVDHRVFERLSLWPGLSFLDLRGTDLEPSQIPPPYKIWSPAQLDASIRERLCYPTPLNDSLSSLLELCTRPQHTQIFSSPSVYRLYIDCLRHISQGSNYIGRSHPNQSAVKRGNTVVTLKSVNSVDTDAHPYSIPAHRRPTLLLGSGDSNRKPPAPLLNPMDEALMNNIAAEEVTADRSRMAALRIHTRHRSRSDDFSPPRDFLLLPRNEYSAARHYQSRARGPSLTRPGKSKARTSRAVSSPEPLILYRVPPSWDDLIDIQAREDGKVASESSSQTTTLGITSVPSGSKKNSSNSTASIRNTDKARMMLERQRELAVKKRKIESPFGSSSSFPIFSGSATSLESSGRRRPEYVKANQAVVMPSFNGMTDRAKVTVGAKLASGSSGVNEKYASPFRRVSHSMVDKKFTAAATTSTQTSTTPATPSSSSRDSGTYTTPIRSVNHTTMSGGVSSTGKQLKPISTIPIPELPEEEKKKLRARASLDSSARSGSTSAGKKGRGSLPGNGSSSGKWKSGDGTSGDIRSMIRNMGSKVKSERS